MKQLLTHQLSWRHVNGPISSVCGTEEAVDTLHDLLKQADKTLFITKTAIGEVEKPNAKCRCRNCGDRYDDTKTRATVAGYCKQVCVMEAARREGYKKAAKSWMIVPSPAEVLREKDKVGHVLIEEG